MKAAAEHAYEGSLAQLPQYVRKDRARFLSAGEGKRATFLDRRERSSGERTNLFAGGGVGLIEIWEGKTTFFKVLFQPVPALARAARGGQTNEIELVKIFCRRPKPAAAAQYLRNSFR